jgi:hypothetical protein
MHPKKRWLLVFAMFLLVWGQFTYACETMEMPPQPFCCCEDGMGGCDTVVPPSDNDNCNHSGSTSSSASCCAVDYQSAAEGAAPSSWSADQSITWLYSIATLFSSYLDALFTTATAPAPPNPDWLLAQADSGRAVYLSTLRLRI